jgi:hypothetical protein
MEEGVGMDDITSAAPAPASQSLSGSSAISATGAFDGDLSVPTDEFAAFESTAGAHPSIVAPTTNMGHNGAPALSLSTPLALDLLPPASGGEAAKAAGNAGDGVVELDAFGFSDDGWGERSSVDAIGSRIQSHSGLTIEVATPQLVVEQCGDGRLGAETATTDLIKADSSTKSPGFAAFVDGDDVWANAGVSAGGDGSGASGFGGDATKTAADAASTVGVAGSAGAGDELGNLFGGLSSGEDLSDATAGAAMSAPPPATDVMMTTPVSGLFVALHTIMAWAYRQ